MKGNKNYTYINECPITGKSNKVNYFSLGKIPLVNNLCKTREESLTCDKYPLEIDYFIPSGESALSCAVDSKLLFSNYLFKSGVNIPYISHCTEMYKSIDDKINDGDIIVDIGGNDGTLLESFKKETIKRLAYLNIDPSQNLTELCIKEKGIATITKFFNYKNVKDFTFKANVIISTNVFQHLKDLKSFVKGIKFLLDKDGFWVLEFPYWFNSMETNQFDQIYHEHMYYHSVTPLKKLFSKFGLKITDVTSQEIHGGSLRLIISHKKSKHETLPSVKEYLKSEKKYDLEYHIKWGKNIKKYINNCQYELMELINEGKTIYGFGAAAKGCIFLNSMGFSYKDISHIIDDTDIKQGKFIPGTGIQIVDRNILKTSTPDYILILAHNFKDYIMQSLRDYGYKGKFIVLVPEFKIYE